MIVIHCIGHRLALACADSSEDLTYIKSCVDTLTTLWKLFEYSSKKMAVFIKTQASLLDMDLLPNVTKKTAKRLKKACKTRWLSTEASIKSAVENYAVIIQALLKIEANCVVSSGLLGKCNNAKYRSTLFILNDVFPILANVSRAFQSNIVNFSRIQPTLEAAHDLQSLAATKAPIHRFKTFVNLMNEKDLLDFQVKDSTYKDMETLMVKYVDALTENINLRFDGSIPLLQTFSIFNPILLPDQLDGYGDEEIATLAGHFFEDRVDEMRAEWGEIQV